MSVNCSATMMGSNDRKLKAGSSSSKPLSSCVAKGQPMCSPEEIKWKNISFFTTLPQPELKLNTVPALLLFLILAVTLVFVFRVSLSAQSHVCWQWLPASPYHLDKQTVLWCHYYNMWTDMRCGAEHEDNLFALTQDLFTIKIQRWNITQVLTYSTQAQIWWLYCNLYFTTPQR